MDKVLGVAYSFQSDMFAAKIGTKAEVDVKTRRQMLSLIHSVFDPLGFIAPATLKGRIMFQSATSLGLDWDDKLPDYLVKEFNEWREKINQLESLKIKSWIATPETAKGKAELHVFCDASIEGYSAAAFVKMFNADGDSVVSLVFARAHIVP